MPTRQRFSARAPNANQFDAANQPWDALKNELEDLLGQVQDQISEIEVEHLPAQREIPMPATNDSDFEARRQAALANVRNAVQRLDQKQAKPKKKKKKKKDNKSDLQTAIAQIRQSTDQMERKRSSHFIEPAPVEHASVGHLEIANIVSQIDGLHRSVRDLSNSVADATHIDRIEEQIARLSRRIDNSQDPHVTALGDQLDSLQYALERLAELQTSQISHLEQLSQAKSDQGNADNLLRLEESMRAIYDKFDALEQSMERPNAGIETIANGIAGIARAISDIQKQDHAGQGQQILAQIEKVSQRLDGLGNTGPTSLSNDVKREMQGLRGQLVNALEPRFSALEERLDEFAATGANSGISGNNDGVFSRLEAFEDRLTQAIEKIATVQASPVPTQNGGVTIEVLKAMENRLSDALAQVRQTESAASAGQAVPADALLAMEERISLAIERLNKQLPDKNNNQFDNLKSIEGKLANSLQRLETLASKPPAASSTENRQAASSATRPSGPKSLVAPKSTLNDDVDAQTVAAKPMVREQKPENADDIPPRPRSFLAQSDENEIQVAPQPTKTATSVAQESLEEDEKATNRESFIAAARRAAQGRENTQAAPKRAVNGGLLGKALARLAPKPKTDDPEEKIVQKSGPKAIAPVTEPLHEDKHQEPPVLAANNLVHKDDDTNSEVLAVGPEPARPQTDVEPPKPRSVLDADQDDMLVQANEKGNFLRRNRQPILLGASILAIAAMTANLVIDNNKSSEGQITPEIAETVDVSEAPRQINLADVAAAISDDETEATPIEMAAMTDAVELSAQDLPLVAPQPPGIDETTTASIPSSPVAVSLPPEAVGPQGLRQAASNGDPRAQFEVGMIFAEGKAVPKDSQEAAVWFERAAAQGFANAQYRLGTAYEHGIGVDKDFEQAKLWYLRSAEAGNRMSMHNLAALLASATDEQRDFGTAARWFEEAAKRGVLDSQFNLGMLYARGLGVSQDFQESYKWFSIAAANGDKDAAKARDDVARSIDAENMQSAKELLAAWRPEPIDLKSNFAPIGTWSKAFNPGKEISDQKIVLGVQIALSRLGFDLGKPDGLMGPKTRDAIRQFERTLGMNESGAINPRLLTVLSSQPA